MTISPEALEKARSLVANYGSDPDGLLVGAIAAALQAERDANIALHAALGAHCRCRWLLNCPDIADNDYKDEETHAAERRARSLLNKDRQP